MINNVQLKLRLITLFSACLFCPDQLLAQSSLPAAGTWDFSYKVEDLELEQKGTFNIVDKNGTPYRYNPIRGYG